MKILELIVRTIIFSWLKKKYKKIRKKFIAYLYNREIQKRNKLENLWRTTKKKLRWKSKTLKIGHGSQDALRLIGRQ
jgi:intergrase/recombinase